MDFEIANSSTRSCVAVIPQTEYDLCESKFPCVRIIMHCAKCLNNVKHEPIDRNHEQKSVEKPKFNSNYFAPISIIERERFDTCAVCIESALKHMELPD